MSAFVNDTGEVLIFEILDKDELKDLKDYKKDGELSVKLLNQR